MAEQKILKSKSEWKALWTNSNPSSSFSNQTVSLDLSRVDEVKVVFRANTGSSYYYTSFPEPDMQMLFSITIYASGIIERHRVYQQTSTGITFESAYEGATVNNNLLIPYKIYAR